MEEAKTILIQPKSLDIFNYDAKGLTAICTPVVVNGCRLGAGVIGYELHGMKADDILTISIKYHESMITDEFREKILNADDTHNVETYLVELYGNSRPTNPEKIKVVEFLNSSKRYIREDLIEDKTEESIENEDARVGLIDDIEQLTNDDCKIIATKNGIFIHCGNGSLAILHREGLFLSNDGNPMDITQVMDKDGNLYC